MADDTVDALQIKIENARRQLPEETLNAEAAVDWRAAILSLREKKGYTFGQLGDLELETELVLCGLVAPADYPKEIQKRMGLSGAETNELVNMMNELVFSKIKEEMIKNAERKKIFQGSQSKETEVLEKAGIEIVNPPRLNNEGAGGGNSKPKSPPPPDTSRSTPPQKGGEELPQEGKLELEPAVHPILAQKLSGTFQVPTVKTEHTLDNLTKTSLPVPPPPAKIGIPKVDPYREIPE